MSTMMLSHEGYYYYDKYLACYNRFFTMVLVMKTFNVYISGSNDPIDFSFTGVYTMSLGLHTLNI